MRILIVAATEMEVSSITSMLKFNGELNSYSFGENSLEILITGVGMVATTFSLTRVLSSKTYDLLLNVGLAGSFKKDIPIGTVVEVNQDCFAELGAEDGDRFLDLKELGIPFENNYTGYFSCLEKPKMKLEFLNSLQKAKGITVNTVHGEIHSITKVVNRWSPDIESMEGASFFYVCNQFKLPGIQIRSISNCVEKRDKEAWNLGFGLRNLADALLQLLKSIE